MAGLFDSGVKIMFISCFLMLMLGFFAFWLILYLITGGDDVDYSCFTEAPPPLLDIEEDN